MRPDKLVVAALLALLLAATAWSQNVQDAPTAPSPSATSSLPLDPEQQQSLQESLKARNYAGAEKLLAAEIEKKPQSAELLKFLASVFFLDGRYLNTAVALKKAEKVAPLDSPSRFTLALSYIILNHRDWARPELEALANAEPRNALYPYWLGRLDYDEMQFTSAVANLRKALELDPAYMRTYDNLGLCYEALGQYDEAIKTYEEAIRLNRLKPQPSPWPPVNLGTLLIKLGKLEEADAALTESLRYDPRFPQARYELGLLREKQKRDDDAIAELKQAAELNPSYAEPHYVLGRIYQRKGDTKKAEIAFETFHRLKRDNSKIQPQ
ncbi:MAG: tetratricopeptide repeat protein [Terriglobia bacterium]|jgi:tetratricopeptide (TPR) repeat protein